MYKAPSPSTSRSLGGPPRPLGMRRTSGPLSTRPRLALRWARPVYTIYYIYEYIHICMHNMHP